MLNNKDHPENKKVNGSKVGFLREERDISKLANNIANLTVHIAFQYDLIKSMAKDMMMQKRALGHLRHLIMRLKNDDEEDDTDFLGLN